MAQLRIGWSEKNITPEKKISLAGQFAERISQYVEKPLPSALPPATSALWTWSVGSSRKAP